MERKYEYLNVLQVSWHKIYVFGMDTVNTAGKASRRLTLVLL